jgi:hypothetical protein
MLFFIVFRGIVVFGATGDSVISVIDCDFG